MYAARVSTAIVRSKMSELQPIVPQGSLSLSTSVQPRARILDVYGAFARDVGGWIAIADLIGLLSLFGIEAQVVRSAASRMKQKDLLESRKIGSAAGYALSAEALDILRDGDARIFRDVNENESTSWIIAVFSVPETERQQRYLIRSRLARLGFGQGPAATWFAPASILADTKRMLHRTGLNKYVHLWQGDYLGFEQPSDLVRSAWDLDAIRECYDNYLREFTPVAEQWRSRASDDQQAFIDYLNSLAVWRPLPFMDPGLPAELISDDWPGRAARELFLELQERLRPQAMRYFVAAAGPNSA